jgi:pimeloyl-ACP methyl ester carboxylesterase
MGENRRPVRDRRRATRLARAVAVIALVIATGCTPPIAVKRLAPRDAQLALTASVLATGEPSDFSRIVLRRYDLLERYEHTPHEALAALHTAAFASTPTPDELFALAELSYGYAEKCAGRPYYLAAALYAYAMLFPEAGAATLDAIDSRMRIATDIYNRALGAAFESRNDGSVTPTGGTFELPFGILELAFDDRSLAFGDARFTGFKRISDYQVVGFRNRYRKAGLGTPLAPRLEAPKEGILRRYISPNLRVPATLLLRVERPREQLAGDRVRATLDFYAFSSDVSVKVDGRTVALESEPTATLAAMLADSHFWQWEVARFLGRALNLGSQGQLLGLEPNRDRTPVIFVHGTTSSSARWADMVNDLMNDPRIHRRYSFWFFSYMSSQPIALSARELRNALTDAMGILASVARSECIDSMVVIGHSQGGLLTKMTAIDSGDRFWRGLTDRPFDDVSMPEATRQLVREALFVKPLPFVKRVVFISTPHRGSFLAGPQIVRRIVERLVRLPVDLISTTTSLAKALVGSESSDATVSLQRIPTSIDNMSPRHPFIRVLASIPVSQQVIANSIIPVKEGYDPYQEGNDGVVEYQSAHIDGVESEFVVRSSHSTQANPHTIEEVRRILERHATAFPCEPAPLEANVQPGVLREGPR